MRTGIEIEKVGHRLEKFSVRSGIQNWQDIIECVDSRGVGLPGAADEPAECALDKLLAIPSFPKAWDEWGYPGTRYRDPTGGFSMRGAASFQENVSIFGELPRPMANGFRILPGDLSGAVRF